MYVRWSLSIIIMDTHARGLHVSWLKSCPCFKSGFVRLSLYNIIYTLYIVGGKDSVPDKNGVLFQCSIKERLHSVDL